MGLLLASVVLCLELDISTARITPSISTRLLGVICWDNIRNQLEVRMGSRLGNCTRNGQSQFTCGYLRP